LNGLEIERCWMVKSQAFPTMGMPDFILRPNVEPWIDLKDPVSRELPIKILSQIPPAKKGAADCDFLTWSAALCLLQICRSSPFSLPPTGSSH
jgi:hypothetical protein